MKERNKSFGIFMLDLTCTLYQKCVLSTTCNVQVKWGVNIRKDQFLSLIFSEIRTVKKSLQTLLVNLI